MFTNKQITKNSLKVATLGTEKIFYTDLTRKQATELGDVKDLGTKIQVENLTEEIEPAFPTSISERAVVQVIAPAGAGKSYYINSQIKDYHKNFPDAPIFYISACDLDDDPSYNQTRDYIIEVDVFALESPLDFKIFKKFSNSLVVFDDCDSGFATDLGYKLIYPDMTEEEYSKLSIRDKRAISKDVSDKLKITSEYVNQTLLSLLKNGRKMGVSVISVGHKFFSGNLQSNIISESTSVVLFPSTTNRDKLKEYIAKKLSFSDKQAKYIIEFKDWYRFEYLELFFRVGCPFLVCNERVEIVPKF